MKEAKRPAHYPYFYGDDDAKQDTNFLLFSLDPIAEDSDLRLYASSLPMASAEMALKTSDFHINAGDQFGFSLCDQISQVCKTFYIFPETSTLVLDYNGYCNLVSKSDMILTTISSELEITKASAMEQAVQFFKEKNVIVQAEGVQGALYKLGTYLQSAGSAGLVTHTVGLARLAGVNGLPVLKAQPALALAIPTCGAMFFYGLGTIAGNGTISRGLITTGDLLAMPMRGVELLWNSYGNPVVYRLFGFPLIMNMTQIFKTGHGYTLQEIAQYIPANRTSIIDACKEKLIKWLNK